ACLRLVTRQRLGRRRQRSQDHLGALGENAARAAAARLAFDLGQRQASQLLEGMIDEQDASTPAEEEQRLARLLEPGLPAKAWLVRRIGSIRRIARVGHRRRPSYIA